MRKTMVIHATEVREYNTTKGWVVGVVDIVDMNDFGSVENKALKIIPEDVKIDVA